MTIRRGLVMWCRDLSLSSDVGRRPRVAVIYFSVGCDMESVLFPTEFLDSYEVTDLAAEYKLALVACAAHPKLSASAVLCATQYVTEQLPLPKGVFWGVVEDLQRRGLLICDIATREIFIKKAFEWHRAPASDEDSPWARQVRAAHRRVHSEKIREAVREALQAAPEARLAALKIPANLLTAMPRRRGGLEWSASETLTHFALATNFDQTAAGVYQPHLAATAAFCESPLVS